MVVPSVVRAPVADARIPAAINVKPVSPDVELVLLKLPAFVSQSDELLREVIVGAILTVELTPVNRLSPVPPAVLIVGVPVKDTDSP